MSGKWTDKGRETASNHIYDTPEEIAQCLRCKRVRCVDCLTGEKKRRKRDAKTIVCPDGDG